MAKCYLMLEDGANGLAFGAHWGCDPKDLPEDVNELTEAQYTLHRFMAVLRGMSDLGEALANQREAKSKIIVPEGRG